MKESALGGHQHLSDGLQTARKATTTTTATTTKKPWRNKKYANVVSVASVGKGKKGRSMGLFVKIDAICGQKPNPSVFFLFF